LRVEVDWWASGAIEALRPGSVVYVIVSMRKIADDPHHGKYEKHQEQNHDYGTPGSKARMAAKAWMLKSEWHFEPHFRLLQF
jgi:hypothetical protein